MSRLYYYLKNSAAGSSSHGSLTHNSVTTAATGTGWTTSRGTVGNTSLMVYASERASSTFAANSDPTGAPTTNDCWRSENKIYGIYANSTWDFSFSVLRVTADNTNTMRMRVRVWKSANEDGSSATELTSSTITTTATTANLTTAPQTITASWNPGSTFTLYDEYLFVQVACEIVSRGSVGTTQDILFRIDAGSSYVFSADLQPVGRQTDTLKTSESQACTTATSVIEVAQDNEELETRETNAAKFYIGANDSLTSNVVKASDTQDRGIGSWHYEEDKATTGDACACAIGTAAAGSGIVRDPGDSYPKTTGFTGAGTSFNSPTFSTSSDVVLLVATCANGRAGGSVQTASIAWTGGTPAGASAWTNRINRENGVQSQWVNIWTATTTQKLSSAQVTITLSSSDSNTNATLSIDALLNTAASPIGNQATNNWVDNTPRALSVTVAGVTTGSWIYAGADGQDPNSSLAPVTDTTELGEYGVGNYRSAVGVNTTGTSGSVLVGWSTQQNYGAVGAQEILAGSGYLGYQSDTCVTSDACACAVASGGIAQDGSTYSGTCGWGTSAQATITSTAAGGRLIVAALSQTIGVTNLSVSGSTLGTLPLVYSYTPDANRRVDFYAKVATGTLSSEVITASWTNNASGMLAVVALSGAADITTKVANTDFLAVGNWDTSGTAISVSGSTLAASGSWLLSAANHWTPTTLTSDANSTELAKYLSGDSGYIFQKQSDSSLSAGSHTASVTAGSSQSWAIAAIEVQTADYVTARQSDTCVTSDACACTVASGVQIESYSSVSYSTPGNSVTSASFSTSGPSLLVIAINGNGSNNYTTTIPDGGITSTAVNIDTWRRASGGGALWSTDVEIWYAWSWQAQTNATVTATWVTGAVVGQSGVQVFSLTNAKQGSSIGATVGRTQVTGNNPSITQTMQKAGSLFLGTAMDTSLWQPTTTAGSGTTISVWLMDDARNSITLWATDRTASDSASVTISATGWNTNNGLYAAAEILPDDGSRIARQSDTCVTSDACACAVSSISIYATADGINSSAANYTDVTLASVPAGSLVVLFSLYWAGEEVGQITVTSPNLVFTRRTYSTGGSGVMLWTATAYSNLTNETVRAQDNAETPTLMFAIVSGAKLSSLTDVGNGSVANATFSDTTTISAGSLLLQGAATFVDSSGGSTVTADSNTVSLIDHAGTGVPGRDGLSGWVGYEKRGNFGSVTAGGTWSKPPSASSVGHAWIELSSLSVDDKQAWQSDTCVTSDACACVVSAAAPTMSSGFPVVAHAHDTTTISSGSYTVTAGKPLVAILQFYGTETANLSNTSLSAGTLEWTKLEESSQGQSPMSSLFVATLVGASSATVTTGNTFGSQKSAIYLCITQWDDAAISTGVHGEVDANSYTEHSITLTGVATGSVVMGGVFDYTSNTTRTLMSGTNDPSDTMLWNDEIHNNTIEAYYSDPATSSSVTIGWSAPTGARQESFVAVEVFSSADHKAQIQTDTCVTGESCAVTVQATSLEIHDGESDSAKTTEQEAHEIARGVGQSDTTVTGESDEAKVYRADRQTDSITTSEQQTHQTYIGARQTDSTITGESDEAKFYIGAGETDNAITGESQKADILPLSFNINAGQEDKVVAGESDEAKFYIGAGEQDSSVTSESQKADILPTGFNINVGQEDKVVADESETQRTYIGARETDTTITQEQQVGGVYRGVVETDLAKAQEQQAGGVLRGVEQTDLVKTDEQETQRTYIGAGESDTAITGESQAGARLVGIVQDGSTLSNSQTSADTFQTIILSLSTSGPWRYVVAMLTGLGTPSVCTFSINGASLTWTRAAYKENNGIYTAIYVAGAPSQLFSENIEATFDSGGNEANSMTFTLVALENSAQTYGNWEETSGTGAAQTSFLTKTAGSWGYCNAAYNSSTAPTYNSNTEQVTLFNEGSFREFTGKLKDPSASGMISIGASAPSASYAFTAVEILASLSGTSTYAVVYTREQQACAVSGGSFDVGQTDKATTGESGTFRLFMQKGESDGAITSESCACVVGTAVHVAQSDRLITREEQDALVSFDTEKCKQVDAMSVSEACGAAVIASAAVQRFYIWNGSAWE